MKGKLETFVWQGPSAGTLHAIAKGPQVTKPVYKLDPAPLEHVESGLGNDELNQHILALYL